MGKTKAIKSKADVRSEDGMNGKRVLWHGGLAGKGHGGLKWKNAK